MENQSIIEGLDKHLTSIKEANDYSIADIESFARKLFKDNESQGNVKDPQVNNAVALLKAVAAEDIAAKREGRNYNPAKVRINAKQLAPTVDGYKKAHNNFWDGGDDEDYFICCFDYDGDRDCKEVGKKFFSPEANKHLNKLIDQIVGYALDDLESYN